MKPEPRVAFVTDALPSIGGGEKVLFTALEVFPCADVFTLIYNRPAFACSPLANRKVKTSLLDQLPLAHKHHRLFLPLMPSAIERFDLRLRPDRFIQLRGGARRVQFQRRAARLVYLHPNALRLESGEHQRDDFPEQPGHRLDHAELSQVGSPGDEAGA